MECGGGADACDRRRGGQRASRQPDNEAAPGMRQKHASAEGRSRHPVGLRSGRRLRQEDGRCCSRADGGAGGETGRRGSSPDAGHVPRLRRSVERAGDQIATQHIAVNTGREFVDTAAAVNQKLTEEGTRQGAPLIAGAIANKGLNLAGEAAEGLAADARAMGGSARPAVPRRRWAPTAKCAGTMSMPSPPSEGTRRTILKEALASAKNSWRAGTGAIKT